MNKEKMNALINQNGLIRGTYDTNKYFKSYIEGLYENDIEFSEELILRMHYAAGLFDGLIGNKSDFKGAVDYIMSTLTPKNVNKVIYTTNMVTVDSYINHRSEMVQQVHCDMYDTIFERVFDEYTTNRDKFPALDYVSEWIFQKYGIFVTEGIHTYNTKKDKTVPFSKPKEKHLKFINLAAAEEWQEQYLNGEENSFYFIVYQNARRVVDAFIARYDIWFDDVEVMITKHGAAIQNAIKNTFGIDCDLVISGDSEENPSFYHILTIAPYRSVTPYGENKSEEENKDAE